MAPAVRTYRVEVYSNHRWVQLGTIKRAGVLPAAWKGAHPGVWSGFVKLTAPPKRRG